MKKPKKTAGKKTEGKKYFFFFFLFSHFSSLKIAPEPVVSIAEVPKKEGNLDHLTKERGGGGPARRPPTRKPRPAPPKAVAEGKTEK